ncbi:MAG: NADH-quinone oxidoreductase subunit NuoE [Desulfobacterales bacterium]|jgi:NADH-quinone oxidoreductase subunit E
MLSEQEKKEIEAAARHYPIKKAAGIEALKIVQKHRGWISDEVLIHVADVLEMSPTDLDAVATFYNFIFRRPVGRHVILVCNSVSCWIMGYDTIVSYLGDRLGIGFGETTGDGRFTLLPNVCLGACDQAPVMMIDDQLYGDLDAEKIDKILASYD